MSSGTLKQNLSELKHWIESITKDCPLGFILLNKGEIVAEWYSGSFSSVDLFEIGSIRKSFNSALIGIGIERGEIDIQTKACSVWSEIVDISGQSEDKEITLHQLASGISGWLTQDPPGRCFQYNNAAFTAAEKVVARIMNLPRDEIASEIVKRFKIPLQANSWEVYHFDVDFDPTNVDIPGPKLAINSTLHDLVKWGQVWLNRGTWADQRLIPEAWVDRATGPVNPHMKNNYYGYNWFINIERALWPAAPADSYGHPGFGTFKSSGEESRAYLWICPSLNSVAAIVTDATVGFANDYLDVPHGITADLIGRIVRALER
jgi:CubicO group peptidase (beta-lactamase class C family)